MAAYAIHQVDGWNGLCATTGVEVENDFAAERAARKWLREGDWPSEDGRPVVVRAGIDRLSADGDVEESWTIEVEIETVAQD